jgi:hypothetical protein
MYKNPAVDKTGNKRKVAHTYIRVWQIAIDRFYCILSTIHLLPKMFWLFLLRVLQMVCLHYTDKCIYFSYYFFKITLREGHFEALVS